MNVIRKVAGAYAMTFRRADPVQKVCLVLSWIYIPFSVTSAVIWKNFPLWPTFVFVGLLLFGACYSTIKDWIAWNRMKKQFRDEEKASWEALDDEQKAFLRAYFDVDQAPESKKGRIRAIKQRIQCAFRL